MKVMNSPFILTRIAIASLLFLTACNLGAASPTGTGLPPTDIGEPLPPSATPPPATTVASPEPEASATEAEQGPQEAIYISSPGQSAIVSSPVQVIGESDSTFEQNLVVAVYAEDGTELALAPTTIQTELGQRGPFSLELEFDVFSQQAGRISVFETSAMDGGIVHLSSVEVVLSPDGEVQNIVAEARPESIIIDSPAQGAQVGGSSFVVSGYSAYFFESTLGYVICGQGGSGEPHLLCGTADNVLGGGSIMIQSPDIGQPGPFEGQVEYSTNQLQPGRLVIFATSPRDGGFIHVASVTVQLSP